MSTINIQHMWKITAILVVLILFVVFVGFKLQPHYVVYTCDGDKKLYAVFMKEVMFINLQDGGIYILPWAMSGSGARYAYKDQSIIFHAKASGAYLRRSNIKDLDCFADYFTAEKALQKLKDKIAESKVNEYWATNSCVSYITGEEKYYYQIEIHEKHTGGCPGYPNTSPLLAMFKVQKNGVYIDYVDLIKSEEIPLDEFIKTSKAIDSVRSQPEVEKFLKLGGQMPNNKSTPRVSIDRETPESWEVHVYSVEEYPDDKDVSPHTGTFNWYSVNKASGLIDCSFFKYKDGKLLKDSEGNEYPCH